MAEDKPLTKTAQVAEQGELIQRLQERIAELEAEAEQTISIERFEREQERQRQEQEQGHRMPTPKLKMPAYGGGKQDLPIFLRKMDLFFELQRVPQSYRAKIFYSALTGQAAAAVEAATTGADLPPVEKMSQILKTRWGTATVSAAMDCIGRLKWTTGHGDIVEFNTRFMAAVSALHAAERAEGTSQTTPEHILLHLYTRAVPSFEEQLAIQGATALPQAMEIVARLAKIREQHEGTGTKRQEEDVDEDIAFAANRWRPRRQQRTRTYPRRTMARSQECPCGHGRHARSECNRCWKCGEMGHRRYECRSGGTGANAIRDASTSAGGSAAVANKDATSTYLVDTGSTVSFATPQKLQQLGNGTKYFLGPQKTILFADGKRCAFRKYATTSMPFLGRLLTHTYIIHEGLPPDAPIILGTDFCARHNVKITFAHGSASIESNGRHTQQRMVSEGTGTAVAMAAASTTQDTRVPKHPTVRIGPEATARAKNLVKQAIRQYARVFDNDLSQPCSVPIEHDLHLTDEDISDAATGRMYRLAPPKLDILRRILDYKVSVGILGKWPDEWGVPKLTCPAIVIAKPGKRPRQVGDFTQLNKKTKFKRVYMPTVEEAMRFIGNKRYLSTIDMKKGYEQIKLSQKAQKLTAILTQVGVYYYKRLAQGLAGAPGTFTEAMQFVFRDMQKHVFCYMDDVIIATDTADEHAKVIKQVLRRLHKFGLKASPDKTELFQTELKLLGFVVSRNAIKVDPSKTAAIARWKEPKTKRQIQQFLGAVQWLRRFIPNLAAKTRPLVQRVRWFNRSERTPTRVSLDARVAFAQLRQEISELVSVARPDHYKPFSIICDASHYAMGAVLQQGGRPIACAAKAFNTAQQNYSVTEKECLAIVWAVQKFQPYISRSQCTVQIVTDHRPLEKLFARDTLMTKSGWVTGRLERWQLALQQIRKNVEYLRGKDNAFADALSRLGFPERSRNVEASQRTATSGQVQVCLAATQVMKSGDITARSQAQDDDCAQLIRALSGGELPPLRTAARARVKRKLRHGKYSLDKQGRLTFEGLVVVPKQQRASLVREAHAFAHGGVARTAHNLTQLHWHGKRQDIRDHCQTCHVCHEFKVHAPARQDPHTVVPVSQGGKFQSFQIDFCGPLDETSSGHKYICTAIDPFTKYPFVMACKSASARAAIKILRHITAIVGTPSSVKTDNGTHFTARQFQAWLKKQGIGWQETAVYHPDAMGQIERLHRELKFQIAVRQRLAGREWDKELTNVIQTLRQSYCRPIQATPMEAMYDITADEIRRRLTEYEEARRGQGGAIAPLDEERTLRHAPKLAQRTIWVKKFRRRAFERRWEPAKLLAESGTSVRVASSTNRRGRKISKRHAWIPRHQKHTQSGWGEHLPQPTWAAKLAHRQPT